jgi:hypothetical protein
VADELRDRIVDPTDHVLYDEARRCLDAGADRAAYIVSWIAAAEGLLGKLRTMAGLHQDLGIFVGQFEKAQRQGTAKDVELISQAHAVGFIDKPERIALDAMRDLRNQYGHPTAASPSHPDAEHALLTAVTVVLAKHPLMMHGAAKQLAGRAATDRHLVPHDEAAIDAFITSRASVVHHDARPTFVGELVAGAERQLGDVNGELLAERCLRMAIVALREWAELLVEPRWNVDQMEQNFPAAAAYVLGDPAVWPLLGSEDQDRVLSHCLDDNIGAGFIRAPGRLLARADQLSAAALLTDSQQARVDEALQAADPRRLLGSGVRFEYAARAMIRKLDDSSYAVAGEGVELLRMSGREALAELDEELLREIGLTLAYAAARNTYAAMNDIDEIAAEPNEVPAPLRLGVVVGGLAGKWWPLHHARTSKAALRLALADPEGESAQAALDALTPERTAAMPSPSLIIELRAMLGSAEPTPAVSKLNIFLDQVESDSGAIPGESVSPH